MVMVSVCRHVVMVVMAAAGMAMIGPAVIVAMVVMRVIVAPMAVVIVPAIVLVGAALGLEGARRRGRRAALAAHHFGEHMVVLDIDRVRRDLGRRMPVADVPGDPQEPQRVFGPDFKQPLRRGLDLDEPRRPRALRRRRR